MEDFPYDKYISTAWTTAKAPKAKTTTLAKAVLKSKSKASEESPSREAKITLKDLCPEEKAKIGELVKKLAMTKSEKETLEKQRQEELQEMQTKLQSLEQHNKKLARSKQKLASQLEQYMEELSSLQKEKSLEYEKTREERIATPVKTLKEESAQADAPKTAEDKETQAEAKVEEQPKPQKAIHEVQSLKREIASLSTSLRNMTSSTMSSPFVNSQMPRSRTSVLTEDRASEAPKPSFKQLFRGESPEEEERFRSVIERAAASSQRAKRFMTESASLSDAKQTQENPSFEELQVLSLPYDPKCSQLPFAVRPDATSYASARPEVPFPPSAKRQEQVMAPEKSEFSSYGGRTEAHFTRPEASIPFPRAESRKPLASLGPLQSDHLDPPLCEADLSIMDQVYNESLFDLVEEMEQSSRPCSVAKHPSKGLVETIEELELGTELEYSAGSSPWVEKDEDSFEELQRRNKLLKSTVGDAIARKKGTWRP